MNLTELVVAFNPALTQARLSRARWAFGFRAVGMALSLGICLFIYFQFGRDWSLLMTVGMFGVWMSVSAFWLVVSIVSWVGASRDLNRIGVGAAVTLSSSGIGLNGRRFAWPEVSRVWAAGGYSGAGPKLVVQTYAGDWEQIPFSFLDAMPGTVDAALRAYGRPGLDLRPLDDLL
ncbi:MAG: hypothetical protein Q3997_02115 [Propionibacteriaceae bacterium]|nr:hypothetical protein [Propionibacteriaceae bacterium]